MSVGAEMRARPDAYESVRRYALARIEQRRLRPEIHLHEIRVEVGAAVEAYQRRAQRGEEVPLHQPAETGERILRSITDFGALTELLARRDVEEIFIEGARVTYLDADGHLRGLDTPTSEVENRQILERLLAVTERQLTTKHPIVQARVLDGTARLTAAIPPIADRTSATLRRYTVRDVTLDQLVERTTLGRAAARFLDSLMHVHSRVAISGEPGAGKTTLAAALLVAIPAGHCVRCCEEIRELAVPLTHGAYYEVRPAALDGTGEISLRDLVKFVLTTPRLRYPRGDGQEPNRRDRRRVCADLPGSCGRQLRRGAPAQGLRCPHRAPWLDGRPGVRRRRSLGVLGQAAPRVRAAARSAHSGHGRRRRCVAPRPAPPKPAEWRPAPTATWRLSHKHI